MKIRRSHAPRISPIPRPSLFAAANLRRITAALLTGAGVLLACSQSIYAQPIAQPLSPTADGTASTPIEITIPAGEFPPEDETTWVEAWRDLPTDNPNETPPFPEATNFAPDLVAAGYRTYFPGIFSQTNSSALNMGSRASVLAYYNAWYRVPTPPMGWTGNYGACSAGATSAAYLEATRRRIVFYRALAGVPTNLTMYAPFVQQAQAAALMMSANAQLSHAPASSWRCFSEAGKTGAGSANLASAPGPSAIDLYMHEPGGNGAVGHRRWLLYPQLSRMGAGSTPDPGGAFGANALYVLDGATIWSARPGVRDGYVAWPPRGYLPYTLAPLRWSFSYPDADFSSAAVVMWRNGSPMPSSREAVVNGFGENTLVWLPQVGVDTWPRPASDTTYQIQINNVRIDGAFRTFTYTVVIFDPG